MTGVVGQAAPAAGRGATHIENRAVARLAAQAAREALRSGTEAHTLPPGRKTVSGTTAVVRGPSGRGGDQGNARVRVSLELGYPSDVGSQCGAVRRHVASRVRELAGMEVLDVAVEVARLHSAHLDGRTPGRVR